MELIRYTEASSPGFRASLDTKYCICQPLEASQVFKVDTDSRGRSYVHFITIWSVVKSHRCCDGDSARGSSQLSMAPCYRSQLIDGAHVSRQRLSTAGRGHYTRRCGPYSIPFSWESRKVWLRCWVLILICRYWSVCLGDQDMEELKRETIGLWST